LKLHFLVRSGVFHSTLIANCDIILDICLLMINHVTFAIQNFGIVVLHILNE